MTAPDFLTDHETLLRLAAFGGVLLAVALWEGARPRRPRAFSRWRRWPSNLGVVLVSTLIVRFALPVAAVGVALVCAEEGIGVFNIVRLPAALHVALTVITLDLVIYAQHVAFHYSPWLWRLHRMHHADLDFDVTTGVRFHPLEILLSMLIKMGAVAALGAAPVGVVVFEALLSATSLFNHANASLPERLDRPLRRIVVTPDMHRVHHSVIRAETDSNFGFNLPWWDRLFGTYRAAPAAGHDGMIIGLPRFREAAELRLDRMLIQPLRRDR